MGLPTRLGQAKRGLVSVDLGTLREGALMRLEDLRSGARVLGIIPGSIVEIVAAIPITPDSYRVIYTVPPSGLDQQILMRSAEERMSEVEQHPTPFDADADEFKLAAEALRIQTAALSDPMLAVTSSELVPLPHQLEAVYGQFLERIPLRFLLADDPGAGKTIMAGLLIKELHLRGDLERCLVIAPGGLVDQWQDELMEKFGMRFSVFSTEEATNPPLGRNIFEDKRRLIVRMDQLARNKQLMEQMSRTSWDLVVVDEAHRMSARFGARGEIVATKRFELGMVLSGSAQHILLMTATPHAGKEENFQLFLSLLDRDRFRGRFRGDMHKSGADNLMIRRIKEELLTLDGKALFPLRQAYTVSFKLSAGESRLYNEVTDYVRAEFNRVDALPGERDARRSTVGFALTVLQRRLASSPEAIYRSLQRRQDRLRQIVKQGKMGSQKAAYDPMRSPEEYSAAEQEDLEDRFADAATAARSVEELQREIDVLTGLIRIAKGVRRSGRDRKWTELRRLLEESPNIRDVDGRRRKVIIFTEHRDTLQYLVGRIRTLLGQSDAVVTIHGGVSRGDRRVIQERFASDPRCLVLVATDAAGEGLNLQCSHLMINYDLPWNPNRIEQRFGRIHRIGQTEMCHLWNLVATDTREGEVFRLLFAKLAEMNRALGDKVFDVLGSAFQDQPLHELLLLAVRHGDKPEVRAHLSTVIDERVGELARKLVEERALNPNVVREADVDRIHREIQEARVRRLQPHDIEGFVRDALRRAQIRLVRREAQRWEIPVVPPSLRERRGSELIQLRYDRICFDPAAVHAVAGDPAQLVGPGHPFLEALLEHTIATYGEALSRGTVLVDRHDLEIEPRLLVALTEEIVDGLDDAVARRCAFVEIWADKRSRPAAGSFLNYTVVDDSEQLLIADLRTQPWLASAASTAESWAIEFDIPEWYEQTVAHRRQFTSRARSLIADRLKQEISLCEGRISQITYGRGAGAAHANPLRAASEEIQSLQRRLDTRMAELDAQEHMQMKPLTVAAVAIVVPQGLLDARSGKDSTTQSTKIVELRAIDATLKAERQLGRTPELMDPNNPGYDIVSTNESGTLFHIEVKGRIAGADDFFVTNREIRVGQNSDNYRLVLVEVSDQGEQLRYLDGPFEDINITTLVDGVSFKWKNMWTQGQRPF